MGRCGWLSANLAEPTAGSGVAEYRTIVVIVIILVTGARLVSLVLIAVRGLPSHNTMKIVAPLSAKAGDLLPPPPSEDQVTCGLASGLGFLGPASWIVALWLRDGMEDWIHVPYVQFVT